MKFEFIRKLSDTSFCKPWLTVEPSNGFIKPGESLDLTLEICVKKSTAGTLNLGTDQVRHQPTYLYIVTVLLMILFTVVRYSCASPCKWQRYFRHRYWNLQKVRFWGQHRCFVLLDCSNFRAICRSYFRCEAIFELLFNYHSSLFFFPYLDLEKQSCKKTVESEAEVDPYPVPKVNH